VRVDLGGARVGVPEQDLDHAHVRPLLHQMGGERVTERAGRDTLGDPGAADRALECALDGGGMDGTESILGAREEQARGTGLAPPLAEQLEGDRRQRDIAVLVSLALTDVNKHAGRVDIGDGQTAHLTETEAGRVEDGENHAVAQRLECGKDGHGLAGGENDGIVLLAAAVGDADDPIGTIHHVKIEEAQSTDGLIEQAVRDLLDVAKEEQVLLDLGKAHAIGRAAEEQSEPGNERDVRAHRALGQIADAHRLLHPLTQGSGDHGSISFQ
jgi:hypothetical protein